MLSILSIKRADFEHKILSIKRTESLCVINYQTAREQRV